MESPRVLKPQRYGQAHALFLNIIFQGNHHFYRRFYPNNKLILCVLRSIESEMDLFDELLDLLKKAGGRKHFPPTLLYKEGWMLRIILSYLSKGHEFHPLTFDKNSTWYSEAQLSTPFHKRTKTELKAEFKNKLDPKDELYENNTLDK